MKTILLRACAFLVLAVSALAEIIGVDTFEYPDAASAGQNGGTFWDRENVAPAVLRR